MATEVINGDVPATGAVALYSVYDMALTIGATKTQDSDGTVYSAGGTRLTSGNSSTNGLGNTSAWFVMQLTDGRQYCFQRGASNLTWRIKYSASAGFTGGSPGAVRVPSAADEAIQFGGGTDAVPTYSTWFTSDNTYRLYGYADTTNGMWFASVIPAGVLPSGGLIHDPVLASSASNTDPYVTYVAAQSSNAFLKTSFALVTATTTGSRTAAWIKKDMVGAAYSAISGNTIKDNNGTDVFPNNAGVDPHDGKDKLCTIPYGRGTTQTGETGTIGTSRIALWPGSTRSTCETYSVLSTRDWIRVGDLVLRWNGSVVVPA